MSNCSQGIKTVNCSDCSLGKLCYSDGLNKTEMQLLDQISTAHKTIQKGEALVKHQQSFDKLYTVRLGSFKAVAGNQLNQQNSERIVEFYLPGEVIGFDAIANSHYMNDIIALETAHICTVDFNQLLDCSVRIPSLQKKLLKLMSQHITAEYGLFPNSTAQDRVIFFLLDISKRYKKRGFSASNLVLTMSREEIASYLGLAAETISRILNDLQDKKLIELNRRRINLIDICKLQNLTIAETMS